METYYRLIPRILIVTAVSVIVDAVQLPTYRFHDNCGDRIASSDVAGVLTFTSPDVHDVAFTRRHCDVIITPKSLGGSSNRVMFYFTQFNLGRDCRDNNLTVFDGRYSNTKVKGISGVLCGHNVSLENRLNIFTSMDDDVRLEYRWSENGDRNNGNFNLTFISFYEGPCPTDDDIFTCTTDKCISSDISCTDDINYCGNGKDNNCDLKDFVESFVNTVVNTIKDIGIIAVVIVSILVIKVCLYDRCKQKYGSIQNVPFIKRLFQQTDTENSSVQRRISVQRSPDIDPDSISIGLYEPERDTPDTHRDDTDTRGTHRDDPPTYDTLHMGDQHLSSTDTDISVEPSAPPISTPLAPPPSYDDVMSNNHKYSQK